MNKGEKPMERLLKISQVADLYGVGNRTVYRFIAAGLLPKPVHVGGSSRLPESEVRACIERLKRERG